MHEEHPEEHRRRAIAQALSFAQETDSTSRGEEQLPLLKHTTSSEQSGSPEGLAFQPVHHVLYCSQARAGLAHADLEAILQESQPYNVARDITGLLCYSESGFVQLLEGPKAAVHELYAKIRRDPRHQGVTTLRDEAGTERWFGQWSMAFTEASPLEYFWLVSHLSLRGSALSLSQVPITDPRLLTLLHAFRHPHVPGNPNACST